MTIPVGQTPQELAQRRAAEVAVATGRETSCDSDCGEAKNEDRETCRFE